MTQAKATAFNQLRNSQRAADEGRFADAADLVRRAIANLKRDGEFYTKPDMAARLLGLLNHLKAQS